PRLINQGLGGARLNATNLLSATNLFIDGRLSQAWEAPMNALGCRLGSNVRLTHKLRGGRLRTLLSSITFMGGVLVALSAIPQNASAQCAITVLGSVNCNADTTTTNTTNIHGGTANSSDRTQL